MAALQAKTLRLSGASDDARPCLYCGHAILVEGIGTTLPTHCTECKQPIVAVPLSPLETTTELNPLPTKIGRYEVRCLTAKRHDGEFYLAFDPQQKRKISLKLPVAAEIASVRSAVIQTLQAAGRLQHPNIVPILEIGAEYVPLFVASLHVPGCTLADALEQGRFMSQRAAQIAAALADALDYAHKQGIVHGTLCPENVLLDDGGAPRLFDFGFAAAVDSANLATMPQESFALSPYLSPEQARGDSRSIGPASDQYALGMMLYEMLTGRLPFESTEQHSIELNAPREWPALAKLAEKSSPELAALCRRALRKQPKERYASAAELAAGLRACFPQAPSTGSQSTGSQSTGPKSTQPQWTPPQSTQAQSTQARSTTAGPLEAPASETPRSKPPTDIVTMPIEAEPPRNFSETLRDALTNSIGMEFVLVNPGEFLMGSPTGDALARSDERPQHNVRITKPFYLGRYPVTIEQFRRFVADQKYRSEAERDGKGAWGFNGLPGDSPAGTMMAAEISESKRVTGAATKRFSRGSQFNWSECGFPQDEKHPVVNVSWNDAAAFVDWLARAEGKSYRLPTEAQWEYACRAGTTTKFYHGDDPETLVTIANISDRSAGKKFTDWTTVRGDDGYVFTSPVGSFQANAFGLFDMTGNVWEWCADWFDEKYYASDRDWTDPAGPDIGKKRVMRGGSWMNVPSLCRSAFRNCLPPSDRSFGVGFRVVLMP